LEIEKMDVYAIVNEKVNLLDLAKALMLKRPR
jgi:hypothetical protein